jgi:hypothetical protein
LLFLVTRSKAARRRDKDRGGLDLLAAEDVVDGVEEEDDVDMPGHVDLFDDDDVAPPGADDAGPIDLLGGDDDEISSGFSADGSSSNELGFMSTTDESDLDVADDVIRAAGERGEAEVVLKIDNGDISYYHTTKRFRAVCRCHGLGCVKERTAIAGKRACQGRPLGFLAAWVLNFGGADDSHSHLSPAGSILTFETRQAGREYLKMMADDDPAALQLLNRERKQHDSELFDEPLLQP